MSLHDVRPPLAGEQHAHAAAADVRLSCQLRHSDAASGVARTVEPHRLCVNSDVLWSTTPRAALAPHVVQVHSVVTKEQMLRTDARRIVAVVTDVLIVCDRTIGQHPGNAMGVVVDLAARDRVAANLNSRSALRPACCSSPQPTWSQLRSQHWTILVDLLPEALRKRHCLAMATGNAAKPSCTPAAGLFRAAQGERLTARLTCELAVLGLRFASAGTITEPRATSHGVGPRVEGASAIGADKRHLPVRRGDMIALHLRTSIRGATPAGAINTAPASSRLRAERCRQWASRQALPSYFTNLQVNASVVSNGVPSANFPDVVTL